MKKQMAAVVPGLFVLILGIAILIYGMASGNVESFSFSDPPIMLAGVFIAIGLTVLLVAHR